MLVKRKQVSEASTICRMILRRAKCLIIGKLAEALCGGAKLHEKALC